MVRILFNKGQQFTKGGESMDVVELQDVIVKEGTAKSDLPWLQLFSSGYRVTSDSINWSEWNGCVYSDIDSKHYYNECKKFDVNKLCSALYNYLLFNVNYHFYCLQLSDSKTSFHILFYFDVPRTEESFKRCAQFVQDTMREAFYGIGAGVIYDWPKVNDGCSKSPVQGMYLTNNPIQYGNYNQQGFGVFEDFESYELISEKDTLVSDIRADGSKLFEFKSFKETTDPIPYKNHYQRRTIYDALIGAFGDKERVNKEWKDIICERLPEANGHTKDFYIKEPNKDNWYSRHNAGTLVFINVLKPFGYSFYKEFEPSAESTLAYTPDVTYELKEGQRLSDLNIEWDPNRINHLFAGCSLGKTYNAKELGKPREIEAVDWVFGARQTKVCFVSPMKSINRDGFEGLNNWFIIDGDHKKENLHQYESIQDILLKEGINICTTWESYCAYEMWDYKFDYVIVDEVHTFYMYNYRLLSIRDMKNALRRTSGIRIIMTGTPSYELQEFDCKKIWVTKVQNKVPAEIVFYNESFRGYYLSDLIEWVKDKNHYAILFDDTANYKTLDLFKSLKINCSIFNSRFEDNVKEVLKKKNVISQISAFSVYGQAGINLYIDPDKKVRVYIPNSDGIGIIQYANRIRNKEVIDRVIIGYKMDRISNSARAINDNVDYSRVEHQVEQLNQISFYSKDPMDKRTYSAIDLSGGLKDDYLDKVDGKKVLNRSLYETYYRIKEVKRYESQIQVIYERLQQNGFNVSFEYLKEDTPDPSKHKNRSNTFAGQMRRIRLDDCMIKRKNDDSYWFMPYDSLKKACTGNVEETIEKVFNYFYLRSKTGFDGAKESFLSFIDLCISRKKTIKKTDFENFALCIDIAQNWEGYYDNSLVAALMDEKWTEEKVTAMYVRAIVKDKDAVKWKMVADESYEIITKLKKIVNQYNWMFAGKDHTNQFETTIDDFTKEILKYITEQHTRGRKEKTGKISRTTEWRRRKRQEAVSK